MTFCVQMPALGESVTEGTVTRWLKQVGDRVELDEPLVEVSTDKVDTEIPSPAAGVLTKIIAHEDETVEVGGDLAVIGDAAETPAGGEPERVAQPAPVAPSQPELKVQTEPEAQPVSQPAPAAKPAPAPEPKPAQEAEPAPAPRRRRPQPRVPPM